MVEREKYVYNLFYIYVLVRDVSICDANMLCKRNGIDVCVRSLILVVFIIQGRSYGCNYFDLKWMRRGFVNGT